jgi:hypothetical protein
VSGRISQASAEAAMPICRRLMSSIANIDFEFVQKNPRSVRMQSPRPCQWRMKEKVHRPTRPRKTRGLSRRHNQGEDARSNKISSAAGANHSALYFTRNAVANMASLAEDPYTGICGSKCGSGQTASFPPPPFPMTPVRWFGPVGFCFLPNRPAS